MTLSRRATLRHFVPRFARSHKTAYAVRYTHPNCPIGQLRIARFRYRQKARSEDAHRPSSHKERK